MTIAADARAGPPSNLSTLLVQGTFASLALGAHACVLGQMLVLTLSLGPQRYGALVFALVVQSYVFLFSSSGIRTVTVREAILDPEHYDATATAYIVLAAVGALVFGLLAGAAASGIDASGEEQLLIALTLAGNVAYAANPQPLFDAHQRLRLSGMLTLATESAALLALLILSWMDQASLPAAGILFLSKWIVNALGHALVYHCVIRPFRFDLDRRHLRTVLRSAWPLTLSAFLTTVPFNAGILFQRSRGDLNDVSFLGLAQQAASGYLLMSAAGIRVVQSHLARAAKEGTPLGRTILGFIVLMGVMAGGAAGAALLLVHGILGPEYHGALVPIAAMLLAGVINSLGGLASAYLVLHRGELAVFASQGVASLVYVLASFALLPTLTPTRSALVTCAAATAGTLLAAVCVYRHARGGRVGA